MKFCILFSVLYLQFSNSYGYPNGQDGVGAYAYQDSTGNRYGGTYDIKDGKTIKTSGDLPPSVENQPDGGNFPGFGFPPFFGGFPFADMFEPEQFFPTFFSNLQNCLQEVFHSNIENQKAALNAAQKAFDLTSNQAGQDNDYMSRFTPMSFPRFGSPNSAIAAAAAGPGFSHQMGLIDPPGSKMRNYNVQERFGLDPMANGNRYSVSSTSYSNSANLNGQEIANRGAETLVDNNGKVSHYAVHN